MSKIIDLTDINNQPIYIDSLDIKTVKELPEIEILKDGNQNDILITYITMNDGKTLRVKQTKEAIEKLRK